MDIVINQEENAKKFMSEYDRTVETTSAGQPETLRSMFTELTFIGSLFLNPLLAKKYKESINVNYDFTADSTKFFYSCLLDIGEKTDWVMNQTTINSYIADNREVAKIYQKYGGYKWIEYTINMATNNNAVENNIKLYNELKKYTIIRAYWLKGFKEFAEHIVKLESFKTMNAKDIKEYINRYVNNVYTNVTKNEECYNITKDCTSHIQAKLEKPQMGLPFAFPMMTQIFNGIRLGQFMAWGMLSNAGKTRFLIRECVNLGFVQGQKVCIISNEMSALEIKDCLITSAINNKDIQEKYKIYIQKDEKELRNGLYKVDEKFLGQQGVSEDGFAERLKDEQGEYIETLEDFKTRLFETSSEYKNVLKITEWIDKEISDKIFVIETGIDYTDNDLQQFIDNMMDSKGIKYFFYDTFKSEIKDIGEWSAMKKTATLLSVISKRKNIFIGATIQLTDDANSIAPLELSSSNIANSKQIKHVLDSLCLFKEIPQNDFANYSYVENLKGNKNNLLPLNDNKRYYGCVVDKNRAGIKTNLLFEVDLNRNIWSEIGVPLKRINKK